VTAANIDTAIAPGQESRRCGLDLSVASDDERAKKQVMKLMQAAGLRPTEASPLGDARLPGGSPRSRLFRDHPP
jgi:predicted dinucleotide-binding enzyme